MGNRPLFSHLLRLGPVHFWLSLAALLTCTMMACGANAPPTPPVHSSTGAVNPDLDQE